jgi:fructose-specific component phosphotransferase system IIB-like protein
VLAAAKHQVLKKVSKARFARLLILGTNVVPNVERYDGRLVIFMNHHSQAVIKDKLLAGDF